MRRLHLLLALLIALVLSIQSNPVTAQNLYFEVPRQTVIVYVNTDGTLSLEYTITFRNTPSGATIDIVDIGMPNRNYRMDTIRADINGVPLTDIRTSTEISTGIEIHLGTHAIRAGQTGTLHIYVGTVEFALGKSSLQETEDYASIVFMPNTFGRRFVTGTTDYTLKIVLPPGIGPDEPRYHTPSANWPGPAEPQARYDDLGRVEYTWTSSEANASIEYIFGASFPIRTVPASVVVATETPSRPAFDVEGLFGCLCTGGIIGLMLGLPILTVISDRRRRLKYLPPKIAIEGHGIKRGLTAVEAAVLMEQPLDKVLTMILFSVLKKGAAIVENRNPLKLEVSKSLPEGLQPYEITFLEAFKKTNDRERRTELQNVMVGLVKSVSEKVKGFSRKETIDYYRSIMEKAWAQVSAADTPDVKADIYEEVMDWTMLDQRWDGRTRDIFGTGPVRVPTWWWRYDPVVRAPGGGFGGLAKPVSPAPTAAPGKSIGIPKLPGSDFAASMVNGVQSFSAGVIGNLTSFTSDITNRTNPVPKTTSSSGWRGGGGGGSSCACACACAGCACACAGGGR